MTNSIICRKFHPISWEFSSFQKFRQMQESVKMLEPQVNYKNKSRANHDCLKLTFLMKRHWFVDLLKVSSDLDSIWWVAKWTNIPQRKPLKGIKVKSGRLHKRINMCIQYSKLSFFINGDWFGHFCKLSSNFAKLCKLSKIQADEGKW